MIDPNSLIANPWIQLLALLGGISGLFSLLIAILALWSPGAARRREDDRTKLRDTSYRDTLIEQWACDKFAAYQTRMASLLGWVGGFYGPRWSTQKFQRCLSLAYIYPIFGLMIAWVGWDVTHLGGVRFFEPGYDWPARLGLSLLLLCLMAAQLWTFANFEKNADWIYGILSRVSDNSPAGLSFLSKVRPAGLRAAFAFAFAAAVAAAVAAAAFAFAFAVAAAVAAAFAAFAVAAFAFAVAAAFAFAAETPRGNALFTIVVLFWLVLPLLNALADWVSVSVTRGYIARSVQHWPGTGRFLVEVGVDLLIALACLAALLFCFWGVMEGACLLLGADRFTFDHRGYLAAVLAGDVGKAVPLVLMIFTTLLPTLWHIVEGWIALTTRRSYLASGVVHQLQATQAGKDLGDGMVVDLSDQLQKARFWGAMQVVLWLALICLSVWGITHLI